MPIHIGVQVSRKGILSLAEAMGFHTQAIVTACPEALAAICSGSGSDTGGQESSWI